MDAADTFGFCVGVAVPGMLFIIASSNIILISLLRAMKILRAFFPPGMWLLAAAVFCPTFPVLGVAHEVGRDDQPFTVIAHGEQGAARATSLCGIVGAGVRNIVAVDSRVPALERLLAGLTDKSETLVIEIGEHTRGLPALLEVLRHYPEVAAVHVVSHGRSGEFYLGSDTISLNSLAAYAEELNMLGGSLAEGGDLILYGCRVGSGVEGERFVRELAAISGLDVAASRDLTGAEALGGDWVLESRLGSIERAPVFSKEALARYPHLLQPANPVINEFATEFDLFGGPGGNGDNGNGGPSLPFDDTHEYIEIFFTPDTDLSGYTLIVLDSVLDFADFGRVGVILFIDHLNGEMTSPNGYYLASPNDGTFLTPTGNDTLPETDLSILLVQDNANTPNLVVNGGASALGDLDFNTNFVIDDDDGSQDHYASVVDAISVVISKGSGVPLSASTVVLYDDAGNDRLDAGSRFPNGQDTDASSDWSVNDRYGEGLFEGADDGDPTHLENSPGARNGPNNAPVAQDDGGFNAVDQDQTLTGENVLASNGNGIDSDPDGDTISVSTTSVTSTQGASVTIAPNGDFSYDPRNAANLIALAFGANLVDTFPYTITDGGLTDSATVNVTVVGVNDGPTARDDSFSTSEDSATTGNDVLADNGNGADSDPEGETLTVTKVNGSGSAVGSSTTLPSGARVLLSSNGTLSYDPNGAFESLKATESALDTLTYTISDSELTDTATISVTINGANDAPTAVDDSGAGFETPSNASFVTASVIANDTDPDLDTLMIASINTTGTQGTVQIASNTTLSYDPNGQFDSLGLGQTGFDTFT